MVNLGEMIGKIVGFTIIYVAIIMAIYFVYYIANALADESVGIVSILILSLPISFAIFISGWVKKKLKGE